MARFMDDAHTIDSMQEEVARALIEARVASARQRQLARQVKNGRREARRADRRVVPSQWWRRFRRPRHLGGAEPTVTAPGLGPIRLETILEATAERIVESGTRTEAATLCAMSAVAGFFSPGAASALVDWHGSEPARLRAFGIVHGVILRDLSARDRSRLFAQLTGTEQRRAQAVVAVEPANSVSRRKEGPVDGRRGEAA